MSAALFGVENKLLEPPVLAPPNIFEAGCEDVDGVTPAEPNPKDEADFAGPFPNKLGAVLEVVPVAAAPKRFEPAVVVVLDAAAPKRLGVVLDGGPDAAELPPALLPKLNVDAGFWPLFAIMVSQYVGSVVVLRSLRNSLVCCVRTMGESCSYR